jgi:hypothetical protein
MALTSLYADLGDRDNAFKSLEIAFQERDQVMVVLNVHRSSIRFATIPALATWSEE